MNLPIRVFRRIKTGLVKAMYSREVVGVLKTAPLQPGREPFIALSMVHHRDVLSYLVAIKSFSRFANPARVVIVCDPSIDRADESIFRAHVPHAELRRAEEFRDPRIPQGGTWERLAAIMTYLGDHYVVQLDADTVTIDPVHEVTSAIRMGRGFVLGGDRRQQRIETLDETSARASKVPPTHIQTLAEQVISTADLKFGNYIRGCSGFTGFPAEPTFQDEFFDFSEKMARKTCGRWAEWGTEQVTSNYLVANARDTVVLPVARYSTPVVSTPETAFLHFIGPERFTSRNYEKTSGLAIEALRRQ